VELLGHTRNPEAIPYVIEYLKDSSDDVRIQAVLALGRLAGPDDPRVLDALFSNVMKEKSTRVLSALVMSIGKVCTTERIIELQPFLEHPDERIIANAIEAMGQVRSPKCSDLILSKLNSRNNRVKANAAMVLFAAGKVEVIDLLKPMLMHSDPLMRSSAAFAIGELTLIAHKEKLIEDWRRKGKDINYLLGEIQASVSMLVALLRDPETIVKRQAIIALGKIKDKSTVLPILEMIEIKDGDKELLREASQALWSIGSHKMIREVINRLV
jgi:HEAT repeat protein